MVPKKVLKIVGLLLFIQCLGLQTILGQNIHAELYIRDHNISREIPKNLQSTRSAVIVIASDQTDWKKVSEEVHGNFKKMSIDAIGYFNVQDIFSGLDPTQGFIKQLSNRVVKNVIFVISPETNNGQAEIIITPFEGNFDASSDKARVAWGSVGLQFDDVFRLLGNDVINAEMDLANFLIPDKPMFFEDAPIIKGTKYDVHSRDLRAVKIGIPKFKNLDSQTPLAIAFNKTVNSKNQKLEELMSSYPYEFGYVNSIDEKDLYKEGYQYVLLNIHTSGLNIKRMLNIQINPGETEYVSINAKTKEDISLERIPFDKKVYKYYVKHLLTGDIYVGDKWDSGETWEKALENYLNNLALFTAR